MSKRWFGYALSLLLVGGVSATEASAQIEVSGAVDFYYAYFFNKVDPEAMRTFDQQHNSFTLGLAEVILEKAPTAQSRVGGRVDLTFGPTAELTSFFENDPWYGDGPEIFRNLQQAYISVMANDQVTIDFGKFVTPAGAEVIETYNNWNYSHSVLFGYAIPLYHAGVRLRYAVNDQLSLAGYVVNGWNSVTDNNPDKTFIASLDLTPNQQLAWNANFIVGKEGNFGGDADQDLMWVFDTSVSFAATEALTLMANFDYGSQAEALGGGDPAKWWGVAAYARLQAQDDWAVVGRVEYLDDEEGGFMAIGQKAQTFTLTSEHNIFNDLLGRVELRFDKIDEDDFQKEDGEFTNLQPSLTIGLTYRIN